MSKIKDLLGRCVILRTQLITNAIISNIPPLVGLNGIGDVLQNDRLVSSHRRRTPNIHSVPDVKQNGTCEY
jgi:hypothetical protein